MHQYISYNNNWNNNNCTNNNMLNNNMIWNICNKNNVKYYNISIHDIKFQEIWETLPTARDLSHIGPRVLELVKDLFLEKMNI